MFNASIEDEVIEGEGKLVKWRLVVFLEIRDNTRSIYVLQLTLILISTRSCGWFEESGRKMRRDVLSIGVLYGCTTKGE